MVVGLPFEKGIRNRSANFSISTFITAGIKFHPQNIDKVVRSNVLMFALLTYYSYVNSCRLLMLPIVIWTTNSSTNWNDTYKTHVHKCMLSHIYIQYIQTYIDYYIGLNQNWGSRIGEGVDYGLLGCDVSYNLVGGYRRMGWTYRLYLQLFSVRVRPFLLP
jgi:hypothetical protein